MRFCYESQKIPPEMWEGLEDSGQRFWDLAFRTALPLDNTDVSQATASVENLRDGLALNLIHASAESLPAPDVDNDFQHPVLVQIDEIGNRIGMV